LTLTLSSTYQTSGNIYDVFLFLNGGVVTIGFNTTPWPSLTGRGLGCAALEINTPLWVNSAAFDTGDGCALNNGSTVYENIGAGQATYVGSVYMTGTGQTSVQFTPTPQAGGTNNVIGIWNAYNRVAVRSLERDSNTSWTYASNSYRAMDGSNNNRVTYIDGLGQSFVTGKVMTIAYNAVAGGGPIIGISQNSVSSPTIQAAYIQTSPGGSADGSNTFGVDGVFPPTLGLNYLQAVEQSFSSTTTTFAFNGNNTYLLYEGDY
jgi:hypothetical protein